MARAFRGAGSPPGIFESVNINTGWLEVPAFGYASNANFVIVGKSAGYPRNLCPVTLNVHGTIRVIGFLAVIVPARDFIVWKSGPTKIGVVIVYAGIDYAQPDG
jgi:hypothetical protein